jgi:hypothetical protein
VRSSRACLVKTNTAPKKAFFRTIASGSSPRLRSARGGRRSTAAAPVRSQKGGRSIYNLMNKTITISAKSSRNENAGSTDDTHTQQGVARGRWTYLPSVRHRGVCCARRFATGCCLLRRARRSQQRRQQLCPRSSSCPRRRRGRCCESSPAIQLVEESVSGDYRRRFKTAI